MKDPMGHGSNAGTHAAGTQKTPQLQRRHFEAIAAELKAKSASPDGVKAMADRLATTNPGLRRDFFVAAATGGDYRFKGPGKNAGAVSKKAAKAMGSPPLSDHHATSARRRASGRPDRPPWW